MYVISIRTWTILFVVFFIFGHVPFSAVVYFYYHIHTSLKENLFSSLLLCLLRFYAMAMYISSFFRLRFSSPILLSSFVLVKSHMNLPTVVLIFNYISLFRLLLYNIQPIRYWIEGPITLLLFYLQYKSLLKMNYLFFINFFIAFISKTHSIPWKLWLLPCFVTFYVP